MYITSDSTDSVATGNESIVFNYDSVSNRKLMKKRPDKLRPWMAKVLDSTNKVH